MFRLVNGSFIHASILTYESWLRAEVTRRIGFLQRRNRCFRYCVPWCPGGLGGGSRKFGRQRRGSAPGGTQESLLFTRGYPRLFWSHTVTDGLSTVKRRPSVPRTQLLAQLPSPA